jgi:hypothetical protein
MYLQNEYFSLLLYLLSFFLSSIHCFPLINDQVKLIISKYEMQEISIRQLIELCEELDALSVMDLIGGAIKYYLE